MAIHSKSTVDELVEELQERHKKLIEMMVGTPITADEIHQHNYPETHRDVIASKVRLAVDDFTNILKEIKSTLGKSK